MESEPAQQEGRLPLPGMHSSQQQGTGLMGPPPARTQQQQQQQQAPTQSAYAQFRDGNGHVLGPGAPELALPMAVDSPQVAQRRKLCHAGASRAGAEGGRTEVPAVRQGCLFCGIIYRH